MSNFPDFLKNEKNNEKILQKNEINSWKIKILIKMIRKTKKISQKFMDNSKNHLFEKVMSWKHSFP